MANKKTIKASKSRHAIIAAARKLFTEYGFSQVSTAQIAKAAGLTTGALFYHFTNKKNLLLVVVQQMQHRFDIDIFEGTSQEWTVFDRMLASARDTLRLSQQPDYVRLVLQEAPTHLGYAELRKIDADNILKNIEPALRMIAGEVSLPDRAVRTMALLILGLLNEACFAMARGDHNVNEDDVIALIEDSIVTWISRMSDRAPDHPA